MPSRSGTWFRFFTGQAETRARYRKPFCPRAIDESALCNDRQPNAIGFDETAIGQAGGDGRLNSTGVALLSLDLNAASVTSSISDHMPLSRIFSFSRHDAGLLGAAASLSSVPSALSRFRAIS